MNNPFQALFNQYRNNPQALINLMMSQNPKARAILTQLQQSGMTPQQFVENYAKQNNIDISPYKNMLGK